MRVDMQINIIVLDELVIVRQKVVFTGSAAVAYTSLETVRLLAERLSNKHTCADKIIIIMIITI